MESREDTLNRKQSVWSSPAGYTWEAEQCILYLFHPVSSCFYLQKESERVNPSEKRRCIYLHAFQVEADITSRYFYRLSTFQFLFLVPRYNLPPGLAEAVLKAFYQQLWQQDANSARGAASIRSHYLSLSLTISHFVPKPLSSHYLSLRTEATVIQSQVETCWFFIGTKNLQSSSVTVSQSFTARRLAGPCWVVEVERWAKFQWAAADFRLCLCNLDSLIFHLSNSGAAGNPWNKVFECQVMWGKQHSKMDWSEGEWSLHSQSHFAVSCLVV